MYFILKTFFYILKNLNYFILNYNNIKHFPFGKDVDKIIINDNKITKIFVNYKRVNNTLTNYKLVENLYFIPKLLNKNNLKLTFEYRGHLLNVSKNLPTDYIIQLMNIFYNLANNNIFIDDIKPWPINRYIINNLTVYDNKIYIVDLGKIKFDTTKNIINKYNKLIIQIIKMKNKIY